MSRLRNSLIPGAQRWSALALVLTLHAVAMAWLLIYAPVRVALGTPTVLNVSLIRPEVPTPPPEPPKAQPKQMKVVKRAPEPVKPMPVLAAQTSAPAPAAVYVPPPAEAPRAPPIDAAPPAPVVAAPAPPKTVSGVEYLRHRSRSTRHSPDGAVRKAASCCAFW